MEYRLYKGNVYRPPSEWDSIIIQSTIGCSHNGCTFCSMYKDKKFCIKPVEKVKEDIEYAYRIYGNRRKVFLADGDALIRKTEEQLELFEFIHSTIPGCERISLYGSPVSILGKSQSDLIKLKNHGLHMVYLGVESGNDEVLIKINKGATAEEILEAGRKIKDAGIKLSVTAIIGLGGHGGFIEHGRDTSKLLSRMKPDYIGLLTLMLEEGTVLNEQYKRGQFQLCNKKDILEEIKIFLTDIDSQGSIFRANHASNYLDLRGTLNEDREKLLLTVNKALEGEIHLKSEFYRGL